MKLVSAQLRLIVPLLIFVGLVLIFWQGLDRPTERLPSPLVNHPVPNFAAEELFNPSVQLTQHIFKGHPTVLYVFATWCSVCRAEHPKLMDLHNQNHIRFIGIDYKDVRGEAINWLKSFGNPYDAVIYDPKGLLAINLGVYGTPETFVVDEKGIIRDKIVGALTDAQWADVQKELLSYARQP